VAGIPDCGNKKWVRCALIILVLAEYCKAEYCRVGHYEYRDSPVSATLNLLISISVIITFALE
jgi:hypothetical protein